MGVFLQSVFLCRLFCVSLSFFLGESSCAVLDVVSRTVGFVTKVEFEFMERLHIAPNTCL